MLTASLQSTWDTQKSRQNRPKYGSNSYQNGYGDEGENKGYVSHDRNLGKSGNYSAVQQQQLQQQLQQQQQYYPSVGQSGGELPNLKLPQQVQMVPNLYRTVVQIEFTNVWLLYFSLI